MHWCADLRTWDLLLFEVISDVLHDCRKVCLFAITVVNNGRHFGVVLRSAAKTKNLLQVGKSLTAFGQKASIGSEILRKSNCCLLACESSTKLWVLLVEHDDFINAAPA